MPYRRLPNTDQARIRALKAAVGKGDVYNVSELAITLKSLAEARNFLSKFEIAHNYYVQCYNNQVKESPRHQANVKMARLYISHFIQVLGMCIMRNEIKRGAVELYGLSQSRFIVPDLMNENAILEWGAKIIAGETMRIQQGGTPIYNPAIAKVSVHYDIFREAFNIRKNAMANTAKALFALSQMRDMADKIILEVWNQVEKYYSLLPETERLEKCQEYGLVYYYRKSEKENR